MMKSPLSYGMAHRRLGLESLEDRRLLAIDFDLLKDVNPLTGSASSNPNSMTEVNGVVYYMAGTATTGRELWRTDGTEAGTFVLKDVNPTSSDASSSGAGLLANVGGTLFFVANDGTHGSELWKSNGTVAGTVLVKDVQPGAGSGVTRQFFDTLFMNMNGVLLFRANDGVHGEELWKSDGTAEGTVLVKDISPGASHSLPQLGVNLGGTYVFSANDGVHGVELWRTDGTEAGTQMIKDIAPGAQSYVFVHPFEEKHAVAGSTLYFVVSANGQRRLWRSDGTEAGTQQVSTLAPEASYRSNVGAAGNTFYFTTSDGVHGLELWKVNATGDGVELVKDITPGANNSFLDSFIGVGDTLYFTAYSTGTSPTLWQSDGTTLGTMPVTSIDAVPVSPFELHNANGSLFFIANGAGSSNELWTVDISAGGARQVKDIRSGPVGSFGNPSATGGAPLLYNAGDILYFGANDGVHGVELWKSNGTVEGTTLVRDINSGVGSGVETATILRGVAYFTANDGAHGSELWRSDGTATGTYLVKDLAIGAQHSDPVWLTVFNDRLYFWARNSDGVYSIWQSDGTAEGTEIIVSSFNGYQYTSFNPAPSPFTVVGSRLFFSAYDATHGTELWSTDGTTAGTSLIKNLRNGVFGSEPDNLIELNGTLLFQAYGDGVGGEIFRSDGTSAGTEVIRDIRPDSSSSTPAVLVRVGNVVFFRANDGANGVELWKTDGTAAGTAMVKDIAPGDLSSSIQELTNVNGILYFSANDGSGGGLWRSDGTETGTYRVAASSPSSIVNVNGVLFFTAADATHGAEVWKYDSAASEAVMLKDVNPIPGRGSAPTLLTNVAGTLYFAANDGSHGLELWQSDGTAAGTTLVHDFAVPGNGQPHLFTRINNRLIVAATTDGLGDELWVGQLPRPAGDYSDDGVVDGTDFLAWQRGFGSAATPVGSGADGDGDGIVDGGDLVTWQDNFGSSAPLLQESAVAAAVASLVSKEEVGDEGRVASEIPPQAPPFEGGGVMSRREAARDAMFAAGDFSRLFGLGGDGGFENSLRRRGRASLARRG